jgi:hypothetical protein
LRELLQLLAVLRASVRIGGHIDMRAHTKILSALRSDTPA